MKGIEIAGPPDGLPIVFLHGAGSNLAMWIPEVERLSGEFRCISIDLPAHGERSDDRFSVEAAVELIGDVIDRHAGGSAALVGLSLGGFVAIAVAGRYPERVSGLVVSGAAYEFHGVTAWVNRFEGLIVPWLGPLMRRKADEALSEIAPPGVGERIAARGHSFKGAGQALRDLAGRHFHPMLVSYPGPVLMLAGERETHTIDAIPGMIDGLADAETEIIEDAGHSCSLSQPDAFSDAVARFMARVRSR